MAAPDLATLTAQRVRAYNRAHPARPLDEKAVLAVWQHEGLSGGVGDNNTSFGPAQLHFGGSYPRSAPQDPVRAQQWATSPAGIDYAVGRAASVAAGQTGARAIDSIVTLFERPANPKREIAAANASYGLPVTSSGQSSSPTAQAGNPPNMGHQILLRLLQQAVSQPASRPVKPINLLA